MNVRNIKLRRCELVQNRNHRARIAQCSWHHGQKFPQGLLVSDILQLLSFSLELYYCILEQEAGTWEPCAFLVTATEQARLAERQSVKELPKYPRYI